LVVREGEKIAAKSSGLSQVLFRLEGRIGRGQRPQGKGRVVGLLTGEGWTGSQTFREGMDASSKEEYTPNREPESWRSGGWEKAEPHGAVFEIFAAILSGTKTLREGGLLKRSETRNLRERPCSFFRDIICEETGRGRNSQRRNSPWRINMS